MTEVYEGEWHRTFDAAGIRQEHFNGRMLLWLNLQLGRTYTSLPEAMQAYAVSQGATNWSSLSLTGGGRGFNPAHLFPPGTLGAWHDFADITSLAQASDGSTPVTAAGDLIGYAADKSGNGNHATQATSTARMTYRDSAGVRYAESLDGTNWLNGVANPKWLHDGTGGYLAVACQAGIIADPNVLFYIAGTRGHSIVNGFTMGFDDRASSSNNNASYMAIATKFGVRAQDAITPNTPHLLEATIVSGANGAKFYVDGVLVSQATLSTPSALDCTYPLNIGAGGNNDLPMTGYIHALITMNRVPTDAERAAVLAYYQ